jgi:cytochrome c553
MTTMRILAALVLSGLPAAAALAAASAQQDYVDAMRAIPDSSRGAVLFAPCASCHGQDGGGNPDGSVPRIAGQHRQVTIRQFVDYRFGRRGDPRMQHIADRHLLPDAQALADVAEFIVSLQPLAPAGTGSGTRAEAGWRIYLERCSACHGAVGEGDAGVLAPRLARQHYGYLLRQIRDAVEGRRPGLAASHGQLLQDLGSDALQDLADTLSRSAGR